MKGMPCWLWQHVFDRLESTQVKIHSSAHPLYRDPYSTSVIPKRRSAARYSAARTPLPCLLATMLHDSKYKVKSDFGVAEQRSAGQRWADYHILRSGSSPDFLQLSPSSTTVQKIFKSKWIQKIRKTHNKNSLFLFH